MADITNRADWIVFSYRDATDLTAKDPIQGENSGNAGSTGQRGRAKKLVHRGFADDTHNANEAGNANEATDVSETGNASETNDANGAGGLNDTGTTAETGVTGVSSKSGEAFIIGNATVIPHGFDATYVPVESSAQSVHQCSRSGKANAKGKVVKPPPADKGPKDLSCILRTFGSESSAIDLVLKLRAQGQSVDCFQPDTGPWQVRIRRVGFPVQTETFRLRKEAKVWATLREAEYHKREMVDYHEADRTTLGQLVIRYRDALPLDPHSDNSLRHRLSKIARHSVCQYKMTALRPVHLAKYRDERLKLVKPATVVAELSQISAIIGHARREWDIAMPRNVATTEFVKRPKIGAEGQRTRRLEAVVGEVKEEQRFFEALMDVRNLAARSFIVVALETGVRRAELLRLKWDRVYLREGCCYIALEAGLTKNGHARQAPLSPMAVNALNCLERKGEMVFEGETRDTIKCCFQRLRERAGLKNFRMHDLRHEFTSRLFEETTLRESEIQVLTGHRDARMLARYSHLRPDFIVRRLAQARQEMKALNQQYSQEAGSGA
jgi:integrase